MTSAKSFVFLLFAEEFDVRRAREQTSRGSAFDQGFDRLFAALAIAEGPAVDVHADKLVGNFGLHITGKLHGIVQSFFAVFEAVFDAILNGFSDLQAKSRTQSFAHGVSAKR